MKNITLRLFVLMSLFSLSLAPALAMRPFLEWEQKLAIIVGDNQSLGVFKMNVGAIADMKKAEYPVRIDDLRIKILGLKSPHPDTVSGNPLNRGQAYMDAANVDSLPNDATIPQWAIDALTPEQRALYDAYIAAHP